MTPLGPSASAAPGAERWFCESCGSPVRARYAYLPGQTYIALGLLDQAADLAPQMHAHNDHCLPWLHLPDGLTRIVGSSRATLNASRGD